VNRQRDAGTRILLDALLAREGVAAQSLAGYDRIEFSHLAVAQLVANGSADAGLAIRAAAQAFGLGFVPVAFEPYDLALPAASLDEPRIAALLATLRDPSFRTDVERLGGYDTTAAGSVRVVEPQPAGAP
jgi:putative molybdopterin biosynthesis protein